EETLINKIDLHHKHAVLYNSHGEISAHNVVLCTNGFEKIHINNKSGDGKDIDKAFHAQVYGIVGYMAGYVEERKKDPIAISYFPHNKDIGDGDPYFYLTRRNFKNENNDNLSLICI